MDSQTFNTLALSLGPAVGCLVTAVGLIYIDRNKNKQEFAKLELEIRNKEMAITNKEGSIEHIEKATEDLLKNNQRAVDEIIRLAEEVQAYHTLEGLYAEKIATGKTPDGAKRTVMTKMRNDVVKTGHKRPKMTAEQAREIAEDWRSGIAPRKTA